MLKFSASMNLLFTEMPFLERFSAAKNAGLQAVDIQIMEAPCDEAFRAVRDADVEVSLINAPLGDLLDGGAGLSGVPGREALFADAMTEALATAELLGCGLVNFGPSRVPQGVTREQCLATYCSNIGRALRLDGFANGGIQAIIEPVNAVDIPDALFSDIDEVAALLYQEFGGAVSLQLDIYHVEKGGKNALEKWRQYSDIIRHVQFSEVPNRTEPGTGSIPFDKIFSEIKNSPYSGWVAAEYYPSRPTIETLDWLTLAS